MDLTTYTLTVPVYNADGKPAAGASVSATLTHADYTPSGVVLPRAVSGESDETGVATLQLVSNLVGTQDSRYRIRILRKNGLSTFTSIQMPQSGATLQQLVDALPITPEYSTAAALSAAQAEAAKVTAVGAAQQASEDAQQTALDRQATEQNAAATAEDREASEAAAEAATGAAQRINTLYWLGV